jgi:outer membrane protein
VRSAGAAFLPSVSLSGGATRQLPASGARTRVENGQVITLPDQPWSYSTGLSATVQLFAGGSRIFDLQQARAQDRAARVNEVVQRYAAALAVKQQFFNVLAARESEAAARAQLEQAEQQLGASIERLRARNVTRSDSLRAAIQVRHAQLARMESRTSLEVANASLTRVVGAPYPVTAADADTSASAGLAMDETALRRLADDGPAVAQAAAELDAARAARRGAWAGYMPAVSASYSRSGSGVGSDLFPRDDAFSYSGSLRLSLSFPIFNQLQREEQRTSADVAEENAAAALRDARLAAREALAQSLGAFRAAEERVASQVATLAAAEEDLRMQQERYALGRSTLLDVLTSQTTLDQARRDLIRARYDQRVARAQLEALVGRDL